MDSSADAAHSSGAIAAALIRTAIIAGNLSPGERLREDVLAAEMGVSRTPIRAALRILEADGYVESTPYAGSRVRIYDLNEVDSALQARALIEGLTARRACDRAEPEQIARMRESCTRYEELGNVTEDNMDSVSAENVEFHDIILEASDSQVLTETAHRLWDLPVARRARSALTSGNQKRVAEYSHRQLTEAIASADADWAETIARAHVLDLRQRVVPHNAHETDAAEARPHLARLNLTSTPDGAGRRGTVVELLRAAIVDGVLQGGQRLREDELAAEYGVSRTPVREALRLLTAEGYLESVRYTGARVRAYDATEVAAALQARTLLEGLAARRAAERAWPHYILRMEDSCDRYEALRDASRGNLREVLKEDNLFHDIVLEAADSRIIATTVQRMWAIAVARTFSIGVSFGSQNRTGADPHRQLTRAITVGDPEWAESVARAHVHELRDQMERWEERSTLRRAGRGTRANDR
jgi:DNA-binding GntR family transcriptional regulator